MSKAARGGVEGGLQSQFRVEAQLLRCDYFTGLQPWATLRAAQAGAQYLNEAGSQMKRTTIAVVIGVVVIVSAGYFGIRSLSAGAPAGDIQTAIDTRRALMKDNGAKMKAMGAVVEAKSGDLATMQQLALGLQANAAKIADLFPARSSLKDLPDKTNAKPEIWDNFEDFKTAAVNLGTEAGKLADAANSGDMAAFAAQFDATGQKGCGGCHTKFRQKLQ